MDTKDDRLALGFSTTQQSDDAPIVKVTSANTKDFIEVKLVSTDRRLNLFIDNWRMQKFINSNELRRGELTLLIKPRNSLTCALLPFLT